MRIEGCKLIFPARRGVAVFALEILAHKVTLQGGGGDRPLGSWPMRDWLLERWNQFEASRKIYRRVPQRHWGVLCLEISTSIIGCG